MKIIAAYNIKGGVGKTATAVNLSYLAAKFGYRTLVWDLDPQAASSYYFRIKPKIKGNSKELVKGKLKIDEVIKGTDFPNLDLLPSDFSFRKLDLVLDGRKKPTHQVNKLLSSVVDDYDLVFLDCPPNISLLSEAVFEASDLLLSPIIPTTLSQRTLDQLKRFISEHKIKKLKIIPFFSMVDQRKKLHQTIMIEMPKKHPELLKSFIPHASDIERMGIERKPLGAYMNTGKSLDSYNRLWNEILEKFDL